MISKYKFILIGFFCLLSFKGYCQTLSADSLASKIDQLGNYLLYRNHDTTYITSYADRFAVKFVAVNKINYFRIRDRGNGTKLHYRPEYGVNLGVGISYKWFAIDIVFNIGLREDKNFEDSEFFDFQGRVFSSKQLIEGSLQYYYAYELGTISGIEEDISEISTNREDIRTISFGLQYLYAFNYDKFSLKAPFILNEIQRKSAGSPIFGASFSFFSMNADSSIVPTELSGYFDQKLHLIDFSAISLAVNFGYMYTFVWKEHFFLTLGFIPGLNFNLGDSKADSRDIFKWNVSYKFKIMNAIGYNSLRFYTGFQLVSDWNNVRIEKNLSMLNSHGSLKLFVGYRFRKKKE